MQWWSRSGDVYDSPNNNVDDSKISFIRILTDGNHTYDWCTQGDGYTVVIHGAYI